MSAHMCMCVTVTQTNYIPTCFGGGHHHHPGSPTSMTPHTTTVHCLSYRANTDSFHVPTPTTYVHSVQQKSSGLKFRMFRSGNDMIYSCQHISSHFTLPIFVHSWHFSGYALQSINQSIMSHTY